MGVTDLIESATAEVANGESEQRVLLSQKLGGTGVEGNESGSNADSSTSLGNGGVLDELANHEEEEGQVEEEEESDQSDVDPQGSQEEEEGYDEPGGQEDSDSVVKFFRGFGVGSGDTVVGVEESRVSQPETAVRGESSGAECVASGELPHSSSKLSKTTDEAGHSDDSVGDGNTASVNVVQGENKGCASEGEETKRTWVTDDPQLRGGVVDVGVGGESASSGTSRTVVVFITDVARVANGGLLSWDGHCVGG